MTHTPLISSTETSWWVWLCVCQNWADGK